MYDPDMHSVRSGNLFTLTLTTPVPEGGKEPGDYESLYNKPRINGVELSGDLSLEDIGIPDLSNVPRQALSNEELEEIIEEGSVSNG